MENRKKGKGPVILLMLVCMLASLGAGVLLGRSGSDLAQNIKDILPGVTTDRPQINRGDAPSVELHPLPEYTDGGYDTTEIFEKVNPSVVSINVYAGTSVSPIGSGTGIVMTEDGYIITNAHVVDGGSSVNIVFEDETQVRGIIVGADSDTDIAVIKVDKTGLKAAEFGDSTQLKIGERVVAIGNAGGLSGTCTQGIISGLNRDMDSGARALDLIQTSAAINPGNSGGPLVNRYGQVIGITSSKIAATDYEGIGFAIPITEAMPIISSLIENGYVTGRAVLGVQVIELNESNGPRNGLPSKGAYIASITIGSDLANKGVRERDVIVEANGREIITTNDLLEELEKFSPGDTMNIGIYRPEDNKVYYIDVILMEAQS